MKKILLIAIVIFLLGITANAQDTAKADAKLTAATVFYGYGAELTHDAKVNVNSSIKEIVISQLSTSIDVNSLQISVPENIALLSQRYSVFYPTVPTTTNPLVQKLQDSILLINAAIRKNNNLIDIEQQTLDKTGKLIESVINNLSDKTISSAETLKLINAYTMKIEKAKTTIFNLNEIQAKLNNTIIDLQKKITEASSQSAAKPAKAYGQLTLQVICNTSGEIPISFSYFTNNAGWSPLYDIRVNSKTNEIKLVYKASVTQSTGIDWKQTKLTLSTGNPSLGGNPPVLNAWYVQLYVPQLQEALSGRLAGVNFIQSFEKDENLKEVITDSYSVERKANVDPSTLQQFTTLTESQLNTNFEIDLPYNIESDGQLHVVNIKTEKINATLKNYAVPKMDADAYLLAEVSDWQNLDLIPGSANIIMDNTYLGKSYIDPNSTADTLNLSLGRDRRVAIKRNTIKEYTSTKMIGTNITQTFTYEITVKNNKLTDVDLLLKDQYPISTIKEVEVKLEDDGNAMVNTDLGVLNWKIQLKPGESKKVRFTYSVKYPKDKRVANL